MNNEVCRTAAVGRSCSRNKNRVMEYRTEPCQQSCGQKRARPISSSTVVDEENYNVNSDQPPPPQSCHGLVDLFGPRRGFQFSSSNDAVDTFYTFRLEHREGGDITMARHPGEERILIFRSDRAGAIAKIIFSSTPGASNNISSNSKNGKDAQGYAIQAKIHVLDVKEEYRGYDLGSLLFSKAVARLKQLYSSAPETEEENMDSRNYNGRRDETTTTSRQPLLVRCQLDVEEDCRRYNKLVNFYQSLGCQVKPHAKIQYMNNNDGETYRKVPMQLDFTVASAASPGSTCHHQQNEFEFKSSKSFLPIVMEACNEKRLSFPTSDGCRTVWLLVDAGNGLVEMHTTKGHFLQAFPCGKVSVDSSADCDAKGDASPFQDLTSTSSSSSCCTQFYLVHAPDATDVMNDGSNFLNKDSLDSGLWLLRSPYGTFLSIDETEMKLVCTDTKSFWQSDGCPRRLICTRETPSIRKHYQQKWQTQTVDYVQRMHQKYLTFQICCMTLKEALNKAKMVEAVSFHPAAGSTPSSIRSLCFRYAEWFRREGQPDWIQITALLYPLARVLAVVDPDFRKRYEETHFDWSIDDQSWIVGCSPPDSTSLIFSRFRWMNPDQHDARYTSSQGMYRVSCGLDQVLLTWSGPEYVAGLCRFNDVDLPEEALAMLRYASLGEWHTNKKYMHLTDEKDDGLLPFVADFGKFLALASTDAMQRKEMREEECEELWSTHYHPITEKYGIDGVLHW